jgi:hypothetical protein
VAAARPPPAPPGINGAAPVDGSGTVTTAWGADRAGGGRKPPAGEAQQRRPRLGSQRGGGTPPTTGEAAN